MRKILVLFIICVSCISKRKTNNSVSFYNSIDSKEYVRIENSELTYGSNEHNGGVFCSGILNSTKVNTFLFKNSNYKKSAKDSIGGDFGTVYLFNICDSTEQLFFNLDTITFKNKKFIKINKFK